MYKKGFTLVELAIVLVVIGMILSMGIKGKALIDAAKWRAEVATLYKIEYAWASFMLKYPGKTPSKVQAGYAFLKLSDFEAYGLNEKTIKSKIGNFRLYPYDFVTSDNSSYTYPLGVLQAKINIPGVITAHPTAFQRADVPASYTCMLENFLDDRKTLSGIIRYYDGGPAVTMPEMQECRDYKGINKVIGIGEINF